MSACLPGAITPISVRPRQCAEPSVAQRNASRCVTLAASYVNRLIITAWRTPSIKFELSLDADPSTPRPIGEPADKLSKRDRGPAHSPTQDERIQLIAHPSPVEAIIPLPEIPRQMLGAHARGAAWRGRAAGAQDHGGSTSGG